MKKFIVCFLLFIFLTCLPVSALVETYPRDKDNLRLPSDVDQTRVNVDDVLKIPSVDSDKKIYDFADLLTDAEETKIYIQLNQFIESRGINAIIITTNDLAGFSIIDYASHFYDYNDFADVGVTFIIYMNGDAPSISIVNSGAATSEVYEAYTDKRIQEMLKHIYFNHIESGDYVGACDKFVVLVDGYYVKTFGEKTLTPPEDETFPWVEIVIITFSVTFIIVLLMISKYQKPAVRVDQLVKKSVNAGAMVVKCEYDKPLVSQEENKSS